MINSKETVKIFVNMKIRNIVDNEKSHKLIRYEIKQFIMYRKTFIVFIINNILFLRSFESLFMLINQIYDWNFSLILKFLQP